METGTIKNTLVDLTQLIKELSEEEFTCKIKALSNGSIGEHCRHIIELFDCLQEGYQVGVVNYDKRKRNKEIEVNQAEAISSISSLIFGLDLDNKNLELEYTISGTMETMPTSYHRELLYNFEHCIHHQAIIKVALIELNKSVVSSSFGVAISTLKYRQECAQ